MKESVIVMAPVKSLPFRIVIKPRTVKVGEQIKFEENMVRISSIKEIEFLPGGYVAVKGQCREVNVL